MKEYKRDVRRYARCFLFFFLLSFNEIEEMEQGIQLIMCNWRRKGVYINVYNLFFIAGNPRNKTALAPGHSLMDWIRLGSSNVDLTGVQGVHQVVTLKELAKHNKKNDAWIAIRGLFVFFF